MSASDGADRRPLTSWKEIAAHFGRDVRTVQRWEKDEGLPVHRHPHRLRNSVYAFTDELDSWWRGHSTVAEPIDPVVVAVDLPFAVLPPSNRRIAPIGMALIAAVALVTTASVLSVLRARPTGAAAAAVWAVEKPFETVVAGDFDGDGRTDIGLSSLPPASARVHRLDAAHALGPVLFEIDVPHDVSPHLAAVADVNGDGLDDLLVSTFQINLERPWSAPSYLLFGRRAWPARITLPRDADVRFEVAREKSDSRLNGCPLSTPVDLNRDGLHDLVLAGQEYSERERHSAGAAFVLYGRRHWPAVVMLPDDGDIHVIGSRTGEGLAQCAAGDWDGDGWTDLAFHASDATLWELLKCSGRTYIFRGGPQWAKRLDAATDYFVRIDGPVPGSRAQAIALADVNGDGRADLVRSAPALSGTSDYPRALRVWFGSDRARIHNGRDEDVRILLPEDGAEWGRLLLAADVSRDGATDVVFGDGRSGAAWLLIGRREWPHAVPLRAAATRLYTADRPLGYYSFALIDADGDGLQELLSPLGTGDDGSRAGLAHVAVYQRLAFQVRPGFDRKLVLVPGVVVVRLAGADVDIASLDEQSFRLNGVTPWQARPADDDGDGKRDLQLYFDTTKMALDSPVATLIGRRRDGHLIGGTQAIEIIRRAADR
jgi:hypothetical protein